MSGRIFLDTSFLVALLLRRDRLHEEAVRLSVELFDRRVITSQPVLVELLAYVSTLGERTREEAVGLVDDLRSDPRAVVVPQTPELFDDGLEIYRARPDKEYSLTDCMSMAICKRLGISDVLTHDKHFTQEGFTILL